MKGISSKIHREKEPLTFRKVVSDRYRTDTIMNLPCTLVVLVMPLVVMGVVLLLAGSVDHFKVLRDFPTVTVGVPFMVELFVIMAILYQLYNRLVMHSGRDRQWRQMLIEFEDRVGADSTALRKLDTSITNGEAFVISGFIKVLMALMFLLDLGLFITFFPKWYNEGIDYVAGVMWVGIVLCIVQSVLISFSVFTFAYRHEKNQNDFTIQLSADLAKKGINIPPMIKIVKHHMIIFHIFLIIITAGIWILFLLYQMFHNMNDHLMNQWVYETELLKVVESNGTARFENYLADYHCPMELTKRQKRKLNRTNLNGIRDTVQNANKMPKILYFAEAFLIFLCATYILKMIALDCEICANYTNYHVSLLDPGTLLHLHKEQWYNLFMLGANLFFLMTTISSMLGIASRRPGSWRKVVRSCVTFTVPLVFYYFLNSTYGLTHIFDMNVVVSMIIMIAVLAMMLLNDKIRDFYAPVGQDMPELAEWIRYAFFGQLGSGEMSSSAELGDVEPPLE